MADNVAITAGSGTNIATDQLAGLEHVQFVKLMDGTLDGSGKIAGDATNGLDVDVTRLPALVAGSANIGDVDLLSIAAGVTVEAVGDVAHDAAAAGNPVLVGGRANNAEPAAVADADAVYMWMTQKGAVVTAPRFPANLVTATHGPAVGTLTTTSNVAVVAAPGVGQSIYVSGILVTNGSATLTRVDYKDGTTTRGSGVAAASGGGFFQTFEPAWKLAANAALNFALSVAVTDVRVVVMFYVAP